MVRKKLPPHWDDNDSAALILSRWYDRCVAIWDVWTTTPNSDSKGAQISDGPWLDDVLTCIAERWDLRRRQLFDPVVSVHGHAERRNVAHELGEYTIQLLMAIHRRVPLEVSEEDWSADIQIVLDAENVRRDGAEMGMAGSTFPTPAGFYSFAVTRYLGSAGYRMDVQRVAPAPESYSVCLARVSLRRLLLVLALEFEPTADTPGTLGWIRRVLGNR